MIPVLFVVNGNTAMQQFENGFALVFSNKDNIAIYLGIYTVVSVTSAMVMYLIIGWGNTLFGFISIKLAVPATALIASAVTFPVIGLQPFPVMQMIALAIESCGAVLWFLGQRWRHEHPDLSLSPILYVAPVF